MIVIQSNIHYYTFCIGIRSKLYYIMLLIRHSVHTVAGYIQYVIELGLKLILFSNTFWCILVKGFEGHLSYMHICHDRNLTETAPKFLPALLKDKVPTKVQAFWSNFWHFDCIVLAKHISRENVTLSQHV